MQSLRRQCPPLACAVARASRQRGARMISSSSRDEESSRLTDLLKQFKDPNSPFHIPEGTTGPSGPDDHSSSRALPFSLPPSSSRASSAANGTGRTARKPLWDAGIQWSDPDDTPSAISATEGESSPSHGRHGRERARSGSASDSELDVGGEMKKPFRATQAQMDVARADAKQYFAIQGFDPMGLTDIQVAWGESDMFQHVNNVNYVRYVETARINWTETLREELPERTVMSMLQGKGMGFIIKDIALRYRHPVTYPDTLVIATRPHSIEPERASFRLAHSIWSLKDNKLACTADSTMVMYDYDHKRRGTLEGEVGMALLGRSGGR